jgi:hypothetical protein
MQQEPGHLDTETVERILHLLEQFLASDGDCVRPEPGLVGEAGRSSMDAEHLCASFCNYLVRNNQSLDLLPSLARLLDLAGFVRNGGVKVMLYRVETGCRTIVADYFQDMSHRLSLALRRQEGEFALRQLSGRESCWRIVVPTASSLISMLRKAKPEEEQLVSSFLPRIDCILIEISRRVDADLKSEWTRSALPHA